MEDKIKITDIYDKNINFLIGAGASYGLFPTLALKIKDKQDGDEQSIMPVEGHAHLILEDVTTDINGLATVPIAPKLRTTISEQPLVLGGIKVLMRLTNDDAGHNRTIPPNRSTYTLTFEEVLRGS